MKRIKIFSDERFEYYCSYCGKETGTKDHVPSKVFLDKPYPENLPYVPACKKCNQDFSLDEEYVACLIESTKSGTTDIDKIGREKIKRIFEHTPKLPNRIEESKLQIAGRTYFKIETDRLKKVITKLIKGHAKFEFSEPQLEDPQYIWTSSLESLTQQQLDDFLSIEQSSVGLLPEIGSRAFQRIFDSQETDIQDGWIEVQKDNYRYIVEDLGNIKNVKLIISEYLAVEAIWEN